MWGTLFLPPIYMYILGTNSVGTFFSTYIYIYRVRHRIGKRKTHTISRLSTLSHVAHVSFDEKDTCELTSRGMYLK